MLYTSDIGLALPEKIRANLGPGEESSTSVVASSRHRRNDEIPAAERGRLYRETSTTPADDVATAGVATSSAAVGSHQYNVIKLRT